MSRFRPQVAVLCIVLLLGLGTLVRGGVKNDKEKPKDAPTLDDRTATLTEVAGGKEKQTKVDLKYSLKVKGYFDADGFNIEEFDMDGPAAKLTDAAGTGQTAILDKGDIIVAVDGKRIKSAQDYVKAINGAADHTKIKLKIRDVRSGQEAEFLADAVKR